MPHTPPLPLGYEAIMVTKYQNNHSIRMIAHQFGVTPVFVRKVLVRNNLEIKPATVFIKNRERTKLAPDKLASLKHDLEAGSLHADAARAYGVTREWVRQLAKQWGLPTGRDARAQMRNQRLQTVIGRQVHDMKTTTVADRYTIWRELWDKNYTAREIANTLALSPQAVAVRICNLRKQYPTWFPTRRKPKAVAVTEPTETMSQA